MLKYLIEKEFKQIKRNHVLPRAIIGFPFMALLIFPLAANFEVKNLKLGIVDNDHSSYSRLLVNKVVASGYFYLSDVSDNYNDAIRKVELDEVDIILEIPSNFELALVKDKNAKVMISANTVNGTRGGLGSAYLAGIINDFSNEVRMEWVQANPKYAAPGFKIMPQFKFNPYLRYPIFMVPALMVMVMTMICGFLPALNIVSEKEKGTMEQMNVTPVTKFNFILAKLIPYWIIGFVVLTICFGVAFLFYGLLPVGNILTIYLFAFVFVLSFSGFGLIVSNFAKSLQQAMFVMFFFVITFIFLSGLYTPVNSMPLWLQNVSIFSPLKYFILVMRSVYLKGSGFWELLKPFLALCCFAVFFNGLAVISYRKKN